MKKQAVELGTSLWAKRGRMALLTLSLTIGLVCLGLLVFGTSGVRANPDITVDGAGAEWDADWEIHQDSTNDIIGLVRCLDAGIGRPYNDPCYARSGYDIVTVSVHFEGTNWYFKLDPNGTTGDIDSIAGSGLDDLGVGTNGDDDGPLSSFDEPGMGGPGFEEYYSLRFRFQNSGAEQKTAKFYTSTGGASIPIGTAHPTYDSLGNTWWGNAALSDTVEFGLPASVLFPNNVCRDQFWLSLRAGSSDDDWNEDQTSPDWIRLFYTDLTMVYAPANPERNEPLTYTMRYTIENSSSLLNPILATNAYITSTVPTSTTYDSCDGGASCGESSGIVTWMLASPITPTATGIVTLVVTAETHNSIHNEAYLHMDEGLCDTDDTDTPTAVALSSFTADWDGDQVAVAWETALEINTVGFNVWRGTSAGGGYVKANGALIPAASPGGVWGGSYSFADAGVTPGTTYYYKLEEVEIGGARNWYGPTSTGGDGPTAVTLFTADTALAWWPVAAGVIAGAGLTAFVVLRRRRQHL